MRNYRMFKFIWRMFEGKTKEELLGMKSNLAMIYAFCATNALFYFMYLMSEESYPTDPEKLKKLYADKQKKDVPEMEVIKLTGLRKMEVINDATVNNTELLDDQ